MQDAPMKWRNKLSKAVSRTLHNRHFRDRRRDENRLHQYIKTTLTTLVEKKMLEKVFDRSIDRWTQSASFMNVFSRRALSSPRFMRPATDFVKSHTDITAEEWRISAKAKDVPPPKLGDPWPRPPLLPPSSDEEERKNSQKSRRQSQVLQVNYFEKGQTHQNLYSSAGSYWKFGFLFSGH